MPPMARSPSVSESDMSRDVEKDSMRDQADEEADLDVDIEKQTSRQELECATDETPMPGTTPPGDGSRESGEYETAEEGRHGFGATLDRVLSRASTKSVSPGPPPDGGLKAWMIVFYVHIVIMNTWGYINAFGLFQTYYSASLSRSPQEIAWIGSIQVFLLFSIGTLTGRLTDAGYFRALFLVGSLLQTGGLFATASATTYTQVFLAQGITMGLGNGCLFCPSMAVLSTYFSKRRALAIGIAACGSATGGLVFPSMVRELLPRIGFAWTVRCLGLVSAVTMAVANVGMRTRIPPRRSGQLVEWSAFKEKEYLFYALGSFFLFLGVYVGFFFLASFARDVIGLSYTSSLDLLLVINGVGTFGRIVPNHMADRAGAINMLVLASAAAGTTAVAWTAVTSAAGLYAWAAFYGTAAGGIQSLFPAGLTSLTTDLRKAGVRMGMVFTIVSFATLAGPPIAGAIVQSQGGRYWGAQLFAGAAILAGAALMVCARVAKSRKLGVGWRAKV